jgi:hypothetical protein
MFYCKKRSQRRESDGTRFKDILSRRTKRIRQDRAGPRLVCQEALKVSGKVGRVDQEVQVDQAHKDKVGRDSGKDKDRANHQDDQWEPATD